MSMIKQGAPKESKVLGFDPAAGWVDPKSKAQPMIPELNVSCPNCRVLAQASADGTVFCPKCGMIINPSSTNERKPL
jgi:hypothetical protein